jgi:hypothetical protein
MGEDLTSVVRRIEREFTEMPGLKLTAAQVHRLCAIPPQVCDSALMALTQAGVLRRVHDGAFVRAGCEGRDIASIRPRTL